MSPERVAIVEALAWLFVKTVQPEHFAAYAYIHIDHERAKLVAYHDVIARHDKAMEIHVTLVPADTCG
jgi:hypothetical protein